MSSQLLPQRGRMPPLADRGWCRMLLACLLLLTCLFWTNRASALTMTQSPSSCSSQTGTGTVAWSNPNNARSSDGSYATASVDGTTTRYLWCNGYGFSIPIGSVINGITINVERKSNSTGNGGSRDASVRIVKSGALVASEAATSTTYPTSDAVEAHGGASFLWGTSWTVADINASNFGAAFAATKPSSGGSAQTVSVDHIQIVVNYTPPLLVNSIALASTDPTTNDANVSWTVTFSGTAFNVTAADFTLAETDTLSGSTITGISGSGSTRTVTAKVGGSGWGTLGLNLVDRGTITDTNGNPLGGVGQSGSSGFTGAIYTIPRPFCSQPTGTGVPSNLTCVCDQFVRSALNPSTIFGANWISSTSDETGIVPRIVNSGRLRLTDNTGNNAKAATVPGIFPAAGNYISVEFQLYAYNGSGADGVAVTLSDYAVPAVPGAFGGSLGYAQKTGSDCGKAGGCPGFAGGWIGVALDEFGNYSNPTEGRIGGPGAIPQSIGVRGSGSAATGYNWIGGKTGVSPNIDSRTSTSAAPGHGYQVIVDARNYTASNKVASVVVNRDTGSGYASQASIPNIYSSNPGQAVVPDNWQISFTGSTGGSTNIHEIGSVRICAQTVYPPGGGSANDFNAIDEGYGNASASPYVAVQNYLSGHIYTKLMGVPFQLNVAALKDNQIQTLYVTSGSKDVTVKLVDNSDGVCVLDDTQANYCSSACKAKPAVAGGSQTMKFVAADKGQKRSADFTINSAYRHLVAIIGDGTTTACSTDGFSVRPTGIASLVSSNATNTGNSGTPILKAGSDKFALTATIPGIAGVANGYTGVPKVDSKAIKPRTPAVKAGDLLGTFAAATSATPNSTASGSMFTYSEVGAITLPGYDPASNATALRGVYDGVASASECATSAQCDVLRAASWTGIDSVSAKGDCVADSYANTKNGEGKYGCNFGLLADASFGRFVPSYLELTGAMLSNRADLACNPASSFTYMDEPLKARFTLTAKNAGGVVTENYAGQLAKLDLSAPANFYLGALDGAAGGTALSGRLQTLSSAGVWAAGVAADVTLDFLFQRLQSPAKTDGPYAAKFGIAPVDGDGIALLATAYDLDIDAPAGNDHKQIGQSTIRFGRLKLSNAFGHDQLDLPIPLEAQFWNGVAFITNTDDSCSPLTNANLVLGSYVGGLNAANMGASHLSGAGTLNAGRGALKLAKPSPAATGSVDLAIKLAGTAAGDDQSCPSKVVNPVQPTGAGLAYLQSQWCGSNFARDPRARVRFGAYKNPTEMIYLRENY
ncbi:MAG: DUF6701 domain-containing protein [Burkholderiaceae bacterium]